MRSSGASLSEPWPAAFGGGRLLTLGNLVRIGLWSGIAAAMLFSLFIAWEQGLGTGLVCLVATAGLAAAALPVALGRGGELGEPIWFVVLVVAVGLTSKAFYLVLGPSKRVRFLLLDKEVDDLLPAALLMAVALLCFSLGYLGGNLRWRIPAADRLRWGDMDSRRFVAVVGALAVFGAYAFVIFASRFEVSLDSLADLSSKRLVLLNERRSFLVHGYLRWGALLGETAFYLVFARWAVSGRRLRSRAGLVVVLFALAAMAFPIFVSSRQGVMFLILRVALIWLYLRGEPSPRRALVVAAASLLLFTSMLALRRDRADWQGIRREVGVAGLLETTVGSRHFLDLTKTAHILDAVPRQLDYKYGTTLMTWAVAPIPRALWPDKPRVGAGGDLTGIFGTVWTSGVPPGLVGELHLNFGIPGVLVGMLSIGFLLRSLHSSLRPRFPEPAFVIIYAFLSTRIALGLITSSVSGSVTRLLLEMIPLTLALLLCTAGRRAAGGAENPGGGSR